ncbi:MAG: MFS transporter [Oscillospiraceae bacterium]
MYRFLKKHRWVILAAGAAIQVLTGVPAAWSVFRAAVAAQYQYGQSASVTVFSLTIAFFGIGCVIGGYVQDAKGPRVAGLMGAVLLSAGFCTAAFLPEAKPYLFYICYSVPVGLGCAFLYPAVMSTAQKWYADKKGLATGIVGGAVGASGAVLTICGRFLIDNVGIRWTLFILGCVMLVVCGIGAAILQNPKDEKTSDGKEKNYTVLQMLKTPQYYELFAIASLATPSVLLFSPVIVELAQQRGLSEKAALLTIIIGSVFSAAGRLLMPWLSDKIGRRYTDMIIFAVMAALSLWFMSANGVLVIIVYSLLTFCYSGEAAVLPAAASDLFGKRSAGVCYGFVALGMSFGSVGFPFLAHCIGGGIAPHIIAVTAALCGLCICFIIKPTQGKRL